MGRRRDDEDDDDFDDDRPARRPEKSGGGGGKSVLMVLGIIGGILLVLALICGGLIWYAVSSAKKAANNLVSQFETTAEADSFLSKLSTDQTQAAYDATAPGFKSSMSRDQLEQLIKRNPLLAKHSSRRALTFNAPTGSSPNRKQTISYELSKLFDDPEPWTPPGQAKPTKLVNTGPRTVTVTVTVAEQAGGFWKVENITVP